MRDLYVLDDVRNAISNSTLPGTGTFPLTFYQAYITHLQYLEGPIGKVILPNVGPQVPIGEPADRRKMIVAAFVRRYFPNATEPVDMASSASRMNRIREIEQVINMEKTSGTWYSWGPPDRHNRNIEAPSLREETISNMSSDQGPGLYIADTVTRTSNYGEYSGARVLVVKMTDVPTINQNNTEQRERLDRLLG